MLENPQKQNTVHMMYINSDCMHNKPPEQRTDHIVHINTDCSKKFMLNRNHSFIFLSFIFGRCYMIYYGNIKIL